MYKQFVRYRRRHGLLTLSGHPMSLLWNKSFMQLRVLVLLSSTLISACATSSPYGRDRLTASSGLTTVYSEVDMQLTLATSTDEDPCAGSSCALDRGFDQQVSRLGERLSRAAFENYPGLKDRINQFQFTVANKREPGATSSADGNIVIYRGVRALRPDEITLSFVIAREMSHVIAQHHEESAATSLLITALVQALLPVANLVRGVAAIVQANAAVTTVTTSAVSFVGSRVAKASKLDEQLQEADAMAIALLTTQGWDQQDIGDSLAAALSISRDGRWLDDLRVTSRRIEPPRNIARAEQRGSKDNDDATALNYAQSMPDHCNTAVHPATGIQHVQALKHAPSESLSVNAIPAC